MVTELSGAEAAQGLVRPTSIVPVDPDDEHIAFSEGLKRCLQTRSAPGGPADLVFEELFAAGGLQGVPLQVEVLVVGQDPGIADEHFCFYTRLRGRMGNLD